MKHSVLLDTSFLIRLLHDEDPLHENAKGYFKYFLENEVALKISTISIAEYCVKGTIDELPLTNLQILPFNLDHAKRTGEFAEAIFEESKIQSLNLRPRAIIPNDAKLFAQADTDASITHFITSDARSKVTFTALKSRVEPRFAIIDIATPYNETFGILDLE
ncbi:MAG: PIN domain-containing protein [Cryomorphaceae bacterium]